MIKVLRALATSLLLTHTHVLGGESGNDNAQVHHTHKYCVLGGGPAGLQMGYVTFKLSFVFVYPITLAL